MENVASNSDQSGPRRTGPVEPSAGRRIIRSVCSVYGLLVLASLVYGSQLLSGLDCWGRGDWDQFTFRHATPRVAMLRDGQLPMWNPYVNGGNVLLAHPHFPAFSPWYLPTLVLGAPLGLRVGVLIFVIVGATGMAALLRRWNVGPAGCLLGGVLMMMTWLVSLGGEPVCPRHIPGWQGQLACP